VWLSWWWWWWWWLFGETPVRRCSGARGEEREKVESRAVGERSALKAGRRQRLTGPAAKERDSDEMDERRQSRQWRWRRRPGGGTRRIGRGRGAAAASRGGRERRTAQPAVVRSTYIPSTGYYGDGVRSGRSTALTIARWHSYTIAIPLRHHLLCTPYWTSRCPGTLSLSAVWLRRSSRPLSQKLHVTVPAVIHGFIPVPPAAPPTPPLLTPQPSTTLATVLSCLCSQITTATLAPVAKV
jgi:hypothetical protein